MTSLSTDLATETSGFDCLDENSSYITRKPTRLEVSCMTINNYSDLIATLLNSSKLVASTSNLIGFVVIYDEFSSKQSKLEVSIVKSVENEEIPAFKLHKKKERKRALKQQAREQKLLNEFSLLELGKDPLPAQTVEFCFFNVVLDAFLDISLEMHYKCDVLRWDDSFDCSAEASARGLRLPSPNKRAVSPLKRYKIKRWRTLEVDTLRIGVQKYGMYPDIFEERTPVDLKDKWRNLTGK